MNVSQPPSYKSIFGSKTIFENGILPLPEEKESKMDCCKQVFDECVCIEPDCSRMDCCNKEFDQCICFEPQSPKIVNVKNWRKALRRLKEYEEGESFVELYFPDSTSDNDPSFEDFVDEYIDTQF